MKIYLATWTEENQKKSLNRMNCLTRLLSFFFVKNEHKGWIRDYAESYLKK